MAVLAYDLESLADLGLVLLADLDLDLGCAS
jgi:hypothetical protein